MPACLQALEASVQWQAWALNLGLVSTDDLLATQQESVPECRQRTQEGLKVFLATVAPCDQPSTGEQLESDVTPAKAQDVYQLTHRLLSLMLEVLKAPPS